MVCHGESHYALFIVIQADSGFDRGLYCCLADEAPVLLVDGRAQASAEHAGFEELKALGDE
jgi:hypothetical protein